MDLLPTVRLTDTQKKVLTKIASAATPVVAGEQISGDQNMLAARKILVDLGLITYSDSKGAGLTDSGRQVMIDHALLDDGGELSADGEKYAYDNKQQNENAYKFSLIKELLF